MRRFGSPGAPVRIGRRLVREDPHRPAVQREELVRSLREQHADRLEGAEHANVGPQVKPLRGPQAEDGSVTLGGDFDVPGLGAPMGGRLEILTAVADPLHRPAELDSGDAGEDFLGVHPQLGTESAANLGSDHADVLLRNADDDPQEDLEKMGHLG